MDETKPYLESPQVQGLTNEEQYYLNKLVQIWADKKSINDKRTQYYKGKTRKLHSVVVPDELKNTVRAISSWAEKAVDMLAALSRFDGYTFQDSEKNLINEVVRANYFRNEYSKAVTSELIHGCAFLTCSAGDRTVGEPQVVISAYSAEQGSCIWDNRRHRTKAGLVLVDADDMTGSPTAMNLYTEDAVIELSKSDRGWSFVRKGHNLGRCLMTTLMYKPGCGVNPTGKSRITKSLMTLIDRAQEEMQLSAIASQFSTFPQKYLLGVEDDFFENNSKLQAYVSNFIAITKDSEGDTPSIGQLAQATMQPHIDLMRQYASECSSITNLPIHSLGVIHDNPASAEAILCSMNDLITDAVALNESNSNALRQIGLMILAISQNKKIDSLSEEELTCEPKFMNPARPSLVTQADAIIKIISAIPDIANSAVILEELGFTEEQRMRLENDRKKEQANKVVDALLATPANTATEQPIEELIPLKQAVNE
ncbi:MAG: phage portal protein [Lachnospiraceae bacterium]|nr:phage portal protein [Lachnospiraceae bacterium]